MMTATREDKPERFAAPDSVTAISICPLSGKMATSACYADHSVSIHMEYFASGTEPIDYCTYHLMRRAAPVTLASATMSPTPSSAPAAAAPAPAPEKVAPVAAAAPTAPPDEPKKKRGILGTRLRHRPLKRPKRWHHRHSRHLTPLTRHPTYR